MSTPVPARPTRRSVARGVAWSLPTVAVASMAPAYAASVVTCPTFPDFKTWSEVRTGTFVNANEGKYGSMIKVMTDSNGSTSSITYTTTIPVVAGTTYYMRFDIQTAKGYSDSCNTVNSRLSIDATLPSASKRNLGSYSSQSGGTVIAPPLNCTASGRTSEFGANGVKGQSYTLQPVLTPTSSGSMTLSMTFTFDPTTGGNNDDWQVIGAFSSCTR